MRPITPGKVPVPVWDMPVRVFHALLVLCFMGAYLTAESERWRLVHVTLGYTVGGLLLFRLIWGFVGSRYARFKSFVSGPASVTLYLAGLWRRTPEHFIGHNPAGAIAIVALLALGLGTALSGWAVYQDQFGEWLEEAHEMFGNAMLMVVLMHIAGVLIASYLHQENLIRAMVTGLKTGAPDDAATESLWSKALAAVMLASVIFFWYLQWL